MLPLQPDRRPGGERPHSSAAARPTVRSSGHDGRRFIRPPSGLGPLVPGHWLLYPKEHQRSFADLGADLFDEFSTVKTTVTIELKHRYGLDVHVFEHGMADTGGRCVFTVDHAHLHFLPLGSVVEIGDGWRMFDGSLTSLREEPPAGRNTSPTKHRTVSHDSSSPRDRTSRASSCGDSSPVRWAGPMTGTGEHRRIPTRPILRGSPSCRRFPDADRRRLFRHHAVRAEGRYRR